MANRREFIKSGLAAAAWGMMARKGMGAAPFLPRGGAGCSGAVPLSVSAAFRRVARHPVSVEIGGLPFADGWGGDDFSNSDIPFHSPQAQFPGGTPPSPTETVDVVVVGGGVAGLTAAYLLRRFRPIVFELHDQFGGTSQGEVWAGTKYSLGGAYIIAPDEGSFLERLYGRLGLDEAFRLSAGDGPAELNDQFVEDYWSGAPFDPEDQYGFESYANLVAYYANEAYPEIPLPEEDQQWIVDLDRISFKQDVEEQLGGPVPDILAAGIQSYFYSSFTAGWEEISAASGWNFVAAEEFGRWVFPGGNAYVVDRLVKKLRRLEHGRHGEICPRHLRAGCRVVDTRMAKGGLVQVTYRDSEGTFRSLLARRVVMALPKHVCKHVMSDLATHDQQKREAMDNVLTRPYVVANVLLEAPVQRDFYDVFLLGDGIWPVDEPGAEAFSRVTDMVSGHYARPQPLPRSVLTLYWPLPYATARFSIIWETAFQSYAEAIAPQVRRMLGLLEVPSSAVRQVRLVRWGHAMPIAYPGFIANGSAANLIRPYEGVVHFAHQDNWALPAFETAVLEARRAALRVSRELLGPGADEEAMLATEED